MNKKCEGCDKQVINSDTSEYGCENCTKGIKNDLDKLYEKLTEYLHCQTHVNLRGCNDVCNETIPILKSMKKNGVTWDDFHNYLLLKCDIFSLPVSSHEFFVGVRKYLDGRK